jgi:exopolysaccharide biosynthesis protein
VAPQAGAWQTVKTGIAYKFVQTSSQQIYLSRIDLRRLEIGFRADQRAHWYRTTSSFARLYGATVAVNGDFFSSSSVSGLAISHGNRISTDTRGDGYVAFGADNRVEMQRYPTAAVPNAELPGWYRQAVGGHPMLLWNGAVAPSADCVGTLCRERHPRTAVGLSSDRNWLFLVVVDGRRTGG